MVFRGFHTVDLFDCPPFEMFTNGDDPVSRSIREQKVFEPQSMALWCRYARQATAILDIGSHTGVYALAASSLRKDVPIHAFEPNPFTAARLVVNRNANDFEQLSTHGVALGHEDTTTDISWTPKRPGWLSAGSAVESRYKHTMTAPVYVRRLDSFDIAFGALPLVKMDVEGKEVAVFLGMKKLLAARPIILLECFDQPKCDAITEMLPKYSFFKIHEDGGLEPRDRLIAADDKADSFNQLLLPSLSLM